jgi:hypothetical protein
MAVWLLSDAVQLLPSCCMDVWLPSDAVQLLPSCCMTVWLLSDAVQLLPSCCMAVWLPSDAVQLLLSWEVCTLSGMALNSREQLRAAASFKVRQPCTVQHYYNYQAPGVLAGLHP